MTEDIEKDEVLFENSFLMTRERYLYLCDHPKAKSASKRLRRWKISQSVGAVAGICAAVGGIIQREIYLAAIGVAFVLAFSYKLFFQRNIKNKQLYATIRKSQMTEEWNRITRFYKNGIEIEDANNTAKISYNKITHVSEDGGECLIYVGADIVLRIAQSEFTLGSYEDFVEFIYKKLAENEVEKADREERRSEEREV